MLNKRIEELRIELNALYSSNADYAVVLEKSQELDILINQSMKETMNNKTKKRMVG